jgi:hypothetical protein
MLVTSELDLSESGSVALYRLTDITFPTVQLHRTLNFERRGVCCVTRNPNEDQPFLIRTRTVIDNLRADESWMAFKYFLRRGCRIRY